MNIRELKSALDKENGEENNLEDDGQVMLLAANVRNGLKKLKECNNQMDKKYEILLMYEQTLKTKDEMLEKKQRMLNEKEQQLKVEFESVGSMIKEAKEIMRQAENAIKISQYAILCKDQTFIVDPVVKTSNCQK